MHDEVERSRKLTLPNLEAPYFVRVRDRRIGELQRVGQPGRAAVRAARSVPRARSPGARGRLQVRQHQLRGRRLRSARATTWSAFRWKTAYPLLRRYLWLETDSATRSRWKPFRASAPPCAMSSRANSSTISRTPSRCNLRPDSRRLAIDEDSWAEPRARSLGDLRAVSRGEDFRRGVGSRATAATTW